MNYYTNVMAVFDGNKPDYHRLVETGATIAGYQVATISNDTVILVQGTNRVELRVGMQMRRSESGKWSASKEGYTASSYAFTGGSGGSYRSFGGSLLLTDRRSRLDYGGGGFQATRSSGGDSSYSFGGGSSSPPADTGGDSIEARLARRRAAELGGNTGDEGGPPGGGPPEAAAPGETAPPDAGATPPAETIPPPVIDVAPPNAGPGGPPP